MKHGSVGNLASGHRFAPGSYDVGGPVGTVHYFSHNQELRLGHLLTITKDNVAQYAGGPVRLELHTRASELVEEGLEILVIGAPNLGEAQRVDVNGQRDW